MNDACEYFTRYGNDRVPGECSAVATMAMRDNGTPPIRVCGTHASIIVLRFPDLGDVAQRFISVEASR